MISQSLQSICSRSTHAVRSVVISSIAGIVTLGAMFVSSGGIGDRAVAATLKVQQETTKVALLSQFDRTRSAIDLGAVATNLSLFRQYCQNPVDAAAQPKPLCLEYTVGGAEEGGLSADDELPGEASTQPEAAIYPVTPLAPIDPYQYDKVQLFPPQ